MKLDFETFNDPVDLTEWVNKHLKIFDGSIDFDKIVSITVNESGVYVLFYKR